MTFSTDKDVILLSAALKPSSRGTVTNLCSLLDLVPSEGRLSCVHLAGRSCCSLPGDDLTLVIGVFIQSGLSCGEVMFLGTEPFIT